MAEDEGIDGAHCVLAVGSFRVPEGPLCLHHRNQWQWPLQRLTLQQYIIFNCLWLSFGPWQLAPSRQSWAGSWGLIWKAEGILPSYFRQVQSLGMCQELWCLLIDQMLACLLPWDESLSPSWHIFLIVLMFSLGLLSLSSSPEGSGSVRWLISSIWEEVNVADIRLSSVC